MTGVPQSVNDLTQELAVNRGRVEMTRFGAVEQQQQAVLAAQDLVGQAVGRCVQDGAGHLAEQAIYSEMNSPAGQNAGAPWNAVLNNALQQIPAANSFSGPQTPYQDPYQLPGQASQPQPYLPVGQTGGYTPASMSPYSTGGQYPPGTKKSSKGLWIGVGGLVVALGVTAAIVLSRQDATPQAQDTPKEPIQTTAPQTPEPSTEPGEAETDKETAAPDPGNSKVPNLASGEVYAWGNHIYIDYTEGETPREAERDPIYLNRLKQVNGLSGVTSIEFTSDAGIALTKEGTVLAWGSKYSGLLGQDLERGYTDTAVAIPGLEDVVSIDTLRSTAVALKKDGTVITWGKNELGALGTDNPDTGGGPSLPATVTGLTDVKQVVTSENTVFAILQDGTVWAWGSNEGGLLGAGLDSEREVAPVQVKGLKDVKTVVSNRYSAHALLDDGTIVGWGGNYNGTLGTGFEGESSNVPVPLDGVKNVRDIQMGRHGAYAILKDDSVVAWDRNSAYQYGKMPDLDPVVVPALTNVKQIINAESANSYAITNDGSVLAWGSNRDGLNGNGQTEDFADAPVKIEGLSQVRTLTPCYNKVYAVLEDNTVMTWGAQVFYDPDWNGDAPLYTTQVQDTSMSNVDQIVCDYSRAFAITATEAN